MMIGTVHSTRLILLLVVVLSVTHIVKNACLVSERVFMPASMDTTMMHPPLHHSVSAAVVAATTAPRSSSSLSSSFSSSRPDHSTTTGIISDGATNSYESQLFLRQGRRNQRNNGRHVVIGDDRKGGKTAINPTMAATTTARTAPRNDQQQRRRQQEYVQQRQQRHAQEEDDRYEQEWMYMSANNTRRVYNFGVGSLLSWSGTQYSEQTHTDPTSSKIMFPPQYALIEPIYPVRVTGIQRIFDYCVRYTAVAAVACTESSPCAQDAEVVGAVFEIQAKDYPAIRSREAAYTYIEVQPKNREALPSAVFEAEGYYFAWSTDRNTIDPTFDCTNATGHARWKPMISQAYWDFMIGGILSWDGQLVQNNMYTWDLDAELQAVADNTELSGQVATMPSLSLQERRDMAVQFVKSTEHAPTIPWRNDRRCPYTGNSIITPLDMLQYPPSVLEGYNATGSDNSHFAIGTVSPIATQLFYDYVDDILREGKWKGQNDIANRIEGSVCTDIVTEDGVDTHHLGIAHDRSYSQSWQPNPYYDTILKWQQEQPQPQQYQNTNNPPTTTTTAFDDDANNIFFFVAAGFSFVFIILGSTVMFVFYRRRRRGKIA